MLSRLVIRLTTVCLLSFSLEALAAVAVPSPAHADSWKRVDCKRNDPRPQCRTRVKTRTKRPGRKPRRRPAPKDTTCRNPQGKTIPCTWQGGRAGADGCYYQPVDASAETITALGGPRQGPGGWYMRTCRSEADGREVGLGAIIWVAGAPPVVSPEVVAHEAVADLVLPQARLQLSPAADQLVNLPLWLALQRSSWASQQSTASVPGLSVTATARPVRAVWSMGNGATVTCAGPGTVWTPAQDAAAASPDCGYTYRHSSASAAGGAWTVSVTVTWAVSWAGGGTSGTEADLMTTASTRVRVLESQALVTRAPPAA